MDVQIEAVPLEQRGIWRNLYPLYQFELSQFWECPMNHFGVFDENPDVETLAQSADFCDRFWEDRGWLPSWIRADGQIAGLSLVGTRENEFVPAHVDCEMMEFWVMPRYRRVGIGRQAAQMILRHGRQWGYGYDWKVLALENNVPAIRFWRRVLGEMNLTHLREERDAEGINWYLRVEAPPNPSNELVEE